MATNKIKIKSINKQKPTLEIKKKIIKIENFEMC